MRFNEDAGEIAFRLRIRYQAACRRNRVAGRAEHTTEISGLPGFDRWRRSGRERWPDHDAYMQRLIDKISNLKSYGKYNHSRPFRPAGSNPPTTDTSMDPFAIVYPHFSAHMHILDDYYVAIIWFAVPASDSCQRCPGWWLLLMVCDSPFKPKCAGTQGGYRWCAHSR